MFSTLLHLFNLKVLRSDSPQFPLECDFMQNDVMKMQVKDFNEIMTS